MQYSIVKDIFGSAWYMDAIGLQQYSPVIRGMLSGAYIQAEKEPKENQPFAISANTFDPLMYSGDDSEAYEDEESREKVVHVLPVRGVMMKHDMLCGPVGTRTLARRLLEADSDDSVIGHVLIMEGPGGAANAVPELSDAIQQCQKPIVAWVDGIMASAHMYVGSYASEIMASRDTDIIGSIGTMIIFSGRKSQSEEDQNRIREITIYADDAFEKNEEYIKAIDSFEVKLVKDRILNPHNKQFVSDIKANRPGVEDLHLHGRTFEAKEVIGSLIDSIGSFNDAVQRVIDLAHYEKNTAGSNNSQTGNQNKNKTMPKQYLNIQKTLGGERLEFEKDGSRTFSTEEMDIVNHALGSSGNEEQQGQLDTANTNLEAANTIINQQKTEIQDLKDELAEFKHNPAEKPASVSNPKDEEEREEDAPVVKESDSIIGGIEKVSEAYLGKKLMD